MRYSDRDSMKAAERKTKNEDFRAKEKAKAKNKADKNKKAKMNKDYF